MLKKRQLSYKSTGIVRCLWDAETAREMTGHPPSYKEVKKMK